MGPSGSGKSTLMHCLAGLDSLTSGAVYIGDTDLSTLDDKALTRLRRDKVGFVFQAYNLLPTLTALENITLPLALGGNEPDQAWLDTGRHDRRPGRSPDATGRASSPAVSSSASPWPARWSRSRRSSSPTSRPATSTAAAAARSSDFMRQAVTRARADDRHGHARPDGGVLRRPRRSSSADGKIVDEMREPTADRVLDRMKQFGD